MKLHKYQWITLTINLIFFCIANNGHARIPEPDNIIYGILPEDTMLITLRVAGEEITSYTRGENPELGDYFVLRVPIDSLDPQEPGTVRPNAVGGLFLDTATEPALTVVIGERGTVLRVSFVMEGDINGDGAVDLSDVVNTLQVLSNDDVERIMRDADINNDGKIGLEELIYVLEQSSHEGT